MPERRGAIARLHPLRAPPAIVPDPDTHYPLGGVANGPEVISVWRNTRRGACGPADFQRVAGAPARPAGCLIPQHIRDQVGKLLAEHGLLRPTSLVDCPAHGILEKPERNGLRHTSRGPDLRACEQPAICQRTVGVHQASQRFLPSCVLRDAIPKDRPGAQTQRGHRPPHAFRTY